MILVNLKSHTLIAKRSQILMDCKLISVEQILAAKWRRFILGYCWNVVYCKHPIGGSPPHTAYCFITPNVLYDDLQPAGSSVAALCTKYSRWSCAIGLAFLVCMQLYHVECGGSGGLWRTTSSFTYICMSLILINLVPRLIPPSIHILIQRRTRMVQKSMHMYGVTESFKGSARHSAIFQGQTESLTFRSCPGYPARRAKLTGRANHNDRVRACPNIGFCIS